MIINSVVIYVSSREVTFTQMKEKKKKKKSCEESRKKSNRSVVIVADSRIVLWVLQRDGSTDVSYGSGSSSDRCGLCEHLERKLPRETFFLLR